MWDRNEETICAISTPHGVGGIAVVRVSGSKALSCVKKISNLSKRKSDLKSHRAYFSEVTDSRGDKLDEVLITYFENGKSYTGEEVVEISCHGSRFITQTLLERLIKEGCRLADRGEFTYRAFMNGKLDLVQAEAVLSLIESQSAASAKVALRQLDGLVSRRFSEQISDLTWCLAHIEASIDFSTEGIDVVDARVLIEKLKKIAVGIDSLIKSYQSGKMVKDGVKVVLVGEPNVGKSSLLNLLLQDERAIVTPFAGTTRDVIDGEVIFDGVKYRISDTAGLRETNDQIEIIGIDKTRKEAEAADVLCFVFDSTTADWGPSLQLARQMPNLKKVFFINKSDSISSSKQADLLKALEEGLGEPAAVALTSSMSEASRGDIFRIIRQKIGSLEYLEAAVLSSARQYEQALYAFEMISKSVIELEQNTGAEFVAMYLKESLISLQKILGQVYDDQIMDRVFKEFCLGK